ncbi:ATP-binding protein [Sphingomonas sp. AOB5]|uniref:ATP-binding protein n=1 Tax=Sphingomonas sp. AOB5 TaxID=3034017 RepID=UPI0023F7F825|nr:ATP-binding protein [Sphingomonas sp. AOB5]MDF7774069.1 ATP-binding protein [Sphingomonas sp. AOB5]
MPIPPRQGDQRSGTSLTWILFPSVILVMVMTFMAVQVLGIVPDAGTVSLVERMDPGNLAREASANLPLILLIAVLMMGGIFVALRLGLRPLRQISELAAGIGPVTISQRLPLSAAPREIAPLVAAFNSTLDRLEAGWRAQREFSANAAHELRTPLASLRAQVESLLEPEDRRDAIEEFERLGRLITQLLALAEADSGEDVRKENFDLVALARSLASDMASGIVAGGRSIAFDSETDRWMCLGAPGLVEVAIRNLIENAVRHAPAGSEIALSVDGSGRLAVSDDGPGVPKAFRTRLFERFSKADAQGPGAGLGLSIVRRVMTVHGGEARYDPAASGARFLLDFSGRGAAR